MLQWYYILQSVAGRSTNIAIHSGAQSGSLLQLPTVVTLLNNSSL